MYFSITCYGRIATRQRRSIQCLRNTGILIYIILINEIGTVLFCLLGPGITSSFYVLYMNNMNFQKCLSKYNMQAHSSYPSSQGCGLYYSTHSQVSLERWFGFCFKRQKGEERKPQFECNNDLRNVLLWNKM